MNRLSVYAAALLMTNLGLATAAAPAFGAACCLSQPRALQVAETVSPAAPASSAARASRQPVPQKTYTREETIKAAETFFGGTTQGLAQAIEKVFADNGQPNAYITGNEGSGAFIVGLRYGAGTLQYKGGGSMPVFWKGPSVGWDFGGNASKVFMLVYDLRWTDQLFRRYPGVDGSLYIVAGVGLNYLRRDSVTIAPIRTGVGLRAGASVGYLDFTRTRSWIPF